VATHLFRLRGGGREEASRQVADLAKRLPAGMGPGLLTASLRVLATREEDADALRALVADQPPGHVLKALRELAARRVQLSPSALRFAKELTAVVRAEREAGPVSAEAIGAIRELFRDVDVDFVPVAAPIPNDRRSIVEMPAWRRLEAGERPDVTAWRDTLEDDHVTRQLSQALLDMIAGSIPDRAPDQAAMWRLEDLYRGFLLSGRIVLATEIVEALGGMFYQVRAAGANDTELRRCIERLANREAVGAMLQALPELPPAATVAARRLIVLLGKVAVRHLVAALSEETDRSRRHQLLDLLTSLGDAVVPHATLLLSDPRWFVVRNMILLLRTVGDQTSMAQIRRCAEHPDLRVRLEAIKSLFAFDTAVPTDLLSKALNDPNPKVAEAAIGLVGSYGITQGVEPLVKLLRRRDLFRVNRQARVLALKALGRLGEAEALPPLAAFFKDSRFSLIAREERLAAFASLGGYPAAAREPLLARGRASRDAEIRAICERLATEIAAPPQNLDETRV
jgi:HEAT repeat protein